jgi:sulfide:quinone oxidoreductase
MPDFRVVICGGGVAALEALLRLRRLGGEQVALTLVCPNEQFHYRPLAVREAFGAYAAKRYAIGRVAADTSATWVRGTLHAVDTNARSIQTEDGQVIAYDALLLAIGGHETAPFEHALVFTDRDAADAYRGVREQIESDAVGSIAFVVPDGPVWPVPLYELALLTAHHARRHNATASIALITAEGRPLKAFGQGAGDAIQQLLAQAGIALHTGVGVTLSAPRTLTFADTRLEADLVVTLPRVSGPSIPGIAAGSRWFVPVNDYCVVDGADGRVYAAGDATDFVIKHGALGAQQADTAAAGIAHLAGAQPAPQPFDPVIRAMVLTGSHPLYLEAHVVKGLGWRSSVYDEPPWPADEKVVTQELGPYLAGLDQ